MAGLAADGLRKLSLRSNPLDGMAFAEITLRLKQAARHASRLAADGLRKLSLRSKPLDGMAFAEITLRLKQAACRAWPGSLPMV